MERQPTELRAAEWSLQAVISFDARRIPMPRRPEPIPTLPMSRRGEVSRGVPGYISRGDPTVGRCVDGAPTQSGPPIRRGVDGAAIQDGPPIRRGVEGAAIQYGPPVRRGVDGAAIQHGPPIGRGVSGFSDAANYARGTADVGAGRPMPPIRVGVSGSEGITVAPLPTVLGGAALGLQPGGCGCGGACASGAKSGCRCKTGRPTVPTPNHSIGVRTSVQAMTHWTAPDPGHYVGTGHTIVRGADLLPPPIQKTFPSSRTPVPIHPKTQQRILCLSPAKQAEWAAYLVKKKEYDEAVAALNAWQVKADQYTQCVNECITKHCKEDCLPYCGNNYTKGPKNWLNCVNLQNVPGCEFVKAHVWTPKQPPECGPSDIREGGPYVIRNYVKCNNSQVVNGKCLNQTACVNNIAACNQICVAELCKHPGPSPHVPPPPVPPDCFQ